MEGLELIAFNIIGVVGSVKSKVMESMEKAKTGEFESVEQFIKEANEFLIQGEKEQF